MRYFLLGCLIVLLLFESTAYAVSTLVYTNEKNNLILNPDGKQNNSVYFFKNKYTQSIWIDRVLMTNKGMGAGFTSYLRPDHWSALNTNKSHFVISCAMMQPGKVIYIDCSKALDVVIPTHLTIQNLSKGTYWLAEDKEWDKFVIALKKRKMTFYLDPPG